MHTTKPSKSTLPYPHPLNEHIAPHVGTAVAILMRECNQLCVQPRPSHPLCSMPVMLGKWYVIVWNMFGTFWGGNCEHSYLNYTCLMHSTSYASPLDYIICLCRLTCDSRELVYTYHTVLHWTSWKHFPRILASLCFLGGIALHILCKMDW